MLRVQAGSLDHYSCTGRGNSLEDTKTMSMSEAEQNYFLEPINASFMKSTTIFPVFLPSPGNILFHLSLSPLLSFCLRKALHALKFRSKREHRTSQFALTGGRHSHFVP